MKKLIAILLATFALAGCVNNGAKVYTQLGLGTPYAFIPEFLKGKVKAVNETVYHVKSENGKMTKGDIFNPKGLDSLRYSHSYIVNFDENGVATYYTELPSKGYQTYSWKTLVEKGKVAKFMAYLDDSLINYQLPKYDDKGWLVGVDIYRPVVDTVFVKVIFANDEKGNYIQVVYQNYKGLVRSKNIMTRNENALVTRREIYNKSDSMTYFENGYYNDKNMLVNQDAVYKGKPYPKWSYQYTFDDHGNWVNQIASKDGKPIIFVERNYIYY